MQSSDFVGDGNPDETTVERILSRIICLIIVSIHSVPLAGSLGDSLTTTASLLFVKTIALVIRAIQVTRCVLPQRSRWHHRDGDRLGGADEHIVVHMHCQKIDARPGLNLLGLVLAKF